MEEWFAVWDQLAVRQNGSGEYGLDARCLGHALRLLGLLLPGEAAHSWWAARAAQDTWWGCALDKYEFASLVSEAVVRHAEYYSRLQQVPAPQWHSCSQESSEQPLQPREADQQCHPQVQPYQQEQQEPAHGSNPTRRKQHRIANSSISLMNAMAFAIAHHQPQVTPLQEQQPVKHAAARLPLPQHQPSQGPSEEPQEELELQALERQLALYHQEKPGLKPGPAPAPLQNTQTHAQTYARLLSVLCPVVPSHMLSPQSNIPGSMNKSQRLRQQLTSFKAKLNEEGLKTELARLQAKCTSTLLEAKVLVVGHAPKLLGGHIQTTRVRACLAHILCGRRMHRNAVVPETSEMSEPVSELPALGPPGHASSRSSIHPSEPEPEPASEVRGARPFVDGEWRPSMRADLQSIEWRPS